MRILSIRFNFNRNNRLDSSGKAPLQIQVHLNNDTRYLSIAKLHPNQWDDKSKKIKMVGGRGRLTKEEKTYLEKIKGKMLSLENRAFSYYEQRMAIAGFVSAREIKDYLKEEKEVSFFTDFLRVEILENQRMKANTKAKAVNFYNLFLNFAKYKNRDNVSFAEINEGFVKEFHKYLQQKRKLDGSLLSDNYVIQMMQVLRTYVIRAGSEIKGNPFQNIKMGKIIHRHVYLTLSELERFENLEINEGLSKCVLTKELCLFSAWTGLRISDLIERKIERGEKESFGLKVKHIQETKAGLMLVKKTKKTRSKGIIVKLPLWALFGGKPQELILKKIKGKKKDEYIFDSIRQRTVNEWVKKFMEMAGIEKELVFHSFRHTFGEIMHNEFDVSLENLRVFMGHSQLRSTEIYAKTKHERSIRALENINWNK